jgi:hypothetical protein
MLDFPQVDPGFAFSKQTVLKANHQPARVGGQRLIAWIKPAREKQGRRRSIPPTTLPAPDIEIGLRHPVNYTMTDLGAGICDPVHNRHKKVAGGPEGGHKLHR